ncbi:MAG TPA: Clp protease N-terminal domain-containing protein [Solirubrobacteraceae bacterium]|nr:Clp protease N-terminal domain-containing protein [Solirubrobacteraceae bacterium]
MFERYTEEARGVVVVAHEEARALRHNYIGTEHLLLALLRLPRDCVVGRVLAGLQLSFDGAVARLLDLVPEGEAATSGQIPFTPRAKQVLELSLREALGRGDREINSEHILLGITRGDKDSVAMHLLREHGVTAEQVRDALLGSLPPSAPAPLSRSILRRSRRTTVRQRPIEIDLSDEARRLLMSAGARALDDGRTLIEIADIGEALRRRRDADDPPHAATG